MKQINILKKAAGALSILLLVLSLAACGNAISENNEDKVVEPVETNADSEITIKGEIKLHGAAPSRAATTSFDSSYTWQITAMKKELMENDAAPTAADTITGMRTKVTSTNYFTIDLPSAGDWVFIIYGFAGTYTQSTLPSTSAAVFMCYDDSHTIKADGTDPKLTFYPTVYTSSLVITNDGAPITGNINLLVSCEAENVSWVSAVLTNSMTPESEPVEISSAGFTNGKSSLVAFDVPVGLYTAKIYFEDNIGNTLYTCTEAISVYPGLTTDTWFGTSSYLSNGEFNLSSVLVEKYDAELVPNTNILLYNYSIVDNGNAEHKYSYYLSKENELENPPLSLAVDSLLESESQSIKDTICFDSQGNLYLLQMNGSYQNEIALQSTKEGWTAPNMINSTTGLDISYGYEKNIAITSDFRTNYFYIFTIEQDAYTSVSVHKYPDLISSNGSIVTHTSQSLFGSEENENLSYCHFAVNNNKLYMISSTSAEDSPYTLRIYDLSSMVQGGSSLSVSATATLNLKNILQIEHVKGYVTDMLYQDGLLYFLYKEDAASFSASSGFYSRGALIKYNLLTGSSAFTGLSSNCMEKDSGFKLQAFSNNYSPSYPLFMDEEKTQEFIPDVSIDDYPVIWQPADNEKSFYGPSRFIGIKPNMFFISDEGMQYYTNSHDVLCRKNLNRCVFVDLKDFCIKEIKNINSSLSMSQDNFYHCYKYDKSGELSELDGITYYYDNGEQIAPYNVGNYYLGIPNTDN